MRYALCPQHNQSGFARQSLKSVSDQTPTLRSRGVFNLGNSNFTISNFTCFYMVDEFQLYDPGFPHFCALSPCYLRDISVLSACSRHMSDRTQFPKICSEAVVRRLIFKTDALFCARTAFLASYTSPFTAFDECRAPISPTLQNHAKEVTKAQRVQMLSLNLIDRSTGLVPTHYEGQGANEGLSLEYMMVEELSTNWAQH